MELYWRFILGGTIGFFVASLCKVSSDGDKRSIMEYVTYKKEKNGDTE